MGVTPPLTGGRQASVEEGEIVSGRSVEDVSSPPVS